MALREFRLPDLGEGLTESDIVAWHVAAGDRVELNQVIAEVETAKALVDLPSPYAGTVATLHAEAGQTVNVGEPLVTFEVADAATPAGAGGTVPDGGSAPSAHAAPPAAGTGEPASAPDGAAHAGAGVRAGTGEGAPSGLNGRAAPRESAEPDDAPEPNLVGYGARPDRAGRPTRRRRRGVPAQAPDHAVTSADAPPPARDAGETGAAARADAAPQSVPKPAARRERPRSTPPVRMLAKQLGVRLELVEGTGEGGLVTRQDVLGAVSCHREAAAPAGSPRPPAARPAARPLATPAAPAGPGGTAGPGRATGPGATAGTTTASRPAETRIPVRGVRKHTAAAMVASAFTAPHATVFLTVDVTRSTELLARLATHRETRGMRITVLALAARALCAVLPRHPELNSRWVDHPDGSAEIVQHAHVNLGIAAATDRGLVVPHVPDAHTLGLAALAEAITDLAETARAGRTAPERLAGGTITITNVGVFGVDAGTPILVPGEAAILGLGAVRRRPWEHDGEVALRDVVTLSLSFDHRVVDGEQGARFLADLGGLLADPGLALLHGPAAPTSPGEAT